MNMCQNNKNKHEFNDEQKLKDLKTQTNSPNKDQNSTEDRDHG